MKEQNTEILSEVAVGTYGSEVLLGGLLGFLKKTFRQVLLHEIRQIDKR